ncbi:unnamed protein product, partial [Sphenostylis stenocarpa]
TVTSDACDLYTCVTLSRTKVKYRGEHPRIMVLSRLMKANRAFSMSRVEDS